MTKQEELHARCKAELAAFVEDLRAKPIDEILDRAKEKVFREEIVKVLGYDDFLEDGDSDALLALDKPLEALYDGYYDNYIDGDENHEDRIREAIGDIAEGAAENAERYAKQYANKEAEPNVHYGGGWHDAPREQRVGRIDGHRSPEFKAAIEAELNAEVGGVQLINGSVRVRVGDWVVVKPCESHGCLIGQITDIEKLGTPEHDTGNPDDDVHVDFTRIPYLDAEAAVILDALSCSYPDAQFLGDIPLDDVIMAPDMLMSLMGQSLERAGELEGVNKSAYETAYRALNEYLDDPETKLMTRLAQNYAEYADMLEGFSTAQLLEMADRLHAMSDAYSYMTLHHDFTADELRFYLQFQSPLEVVADEWQERNRDFDDFSFAMRDVYAHRESSVNGYALMPGADAPHPADTGLRKFMDVSVLDFLGSIAEKTIVHYPNDWNIDRDLLREYAASKDHEDKRLVWHVCATGTHIRPERDVYVKDSGAYSYMTDYHQNDPDMFGYVIELTGINERGIIFGNVYDVGDYAAYAKHVCDTALPLTTVTLTYSDEWGVNAGKTITVPRSEYDGDRARLMSKSGKVTDVRFNPANELELAMVVRMEHEGRMKQPIGDRKSHLERLAAKLAKVRGGTEQPNGGEQPNDTEQSGVVLLPPGEIWSAPSPDPLTFRERQEAFMKEVTGESHNEPPPPATKGKASFAARLNDGVAKVAAYKEQKAQEAANGLAAPNTAKKHNTDRE